jgi:hypothetical protein
MKKRIESGWPQNELWKEKRAQRKTSTEKTRPEGEVTNLSLVGFSQRYDEMGKVKGMDKGRLMQRRGRRWGFR